MDFGGAGKAAYRLHKGLCELGLDSTLAVLSKKSKDPTVKVIPETLASYNRLCDLPEYDSGVMPKQWGLWNGALEQAWGKPDHHIEAFTGTWSPVRLDLIEELKGCDIVHLHWVAGMFDYFMGSRWLRGKKVIWTLHDMNPFTGGCHFTGGCDHFKGECGGCPMINSRTLDDASRQTYFAKKYFFTHQPIPIVTPSRWLAKQAQMSSLLRSLKVRVVPYGCDKTVFRPYPKEAAKEALRLPLAAKKVLLFGADYNSKRKGFNLLLEAIDLEGSVRTNPNVFLGIFGVPPDEVLAKYKTKALNFGRINVEETLAKVYSAAEAMMVSSIEDNLPNTAIESILCGTPVLGFDVGGMPDIIDDPALGALVKAGDVQALARAIRAVLTRPEDHAAASRCRQLAVTKYDLRLQAEQYLALYDELLGARPAETMPRLAAAR